MESRSRQKIIDLKYRGFICRIRKRVIPGISVFCAHPDGKIRSGPDSPGLPFLNSTISMKHLQQLIDLVLELPNEQQNKNDFEWAEYLKSKGAF